MMLILLPGSHTVTAYLSPRLFQHSFGTVLRRLLETHVIDAPLFCILPLLFSSQTTMPVSTATSPAHVAVSTPKTLSRPALLTLQGLYSTSKTVYATYCPAKASELLEAAMTKVLTAGVPAVEPFVAKVLPASNGSNKGQAAHSDLPTDLAQVDALLAAAFSTGDAKIDEYVLFAQTKASSTKATVAAKVESVKASAAATKAWAHEKYDDATLANAKALVARKMGEEPFSSAASAAGLYLERAQPYYAAMASNVAPAKAVLGEMVGYARHDLATKGVVQVAQESAEALKVAGCEALEVCRAKGAVAGVKELSACALAAAAAKLEAAKVVPVKAPHVVATAPEAAPVAVQASEPSTPSTKTSTKALKKEVFMDAQME